MYMCLLLQARVRRCLVNVCVCVCVCVYVVKMCNVMMYVCCKGIKGGTMM